MAKCHYLLSDSRLCLKPAVIASDRVMGKDFKAEYTLNYCQDHKVQAGVIGPDPGPCIRILRIRELNPR